MKQTIYIDVLVAVNLFINYFLLLAVARFLKILVRRRRILAGAALGAVFSLMILLPEMSALLSFFVKIGLSVAVVLTTFFRLELKQFLKALACFYLINFAFAGLMIAIWYLAAPPGLTMNNGIVYINISPLLLLFTTVLSYFIIRLVSRLSGQEIPKESFCDVIIENNGKSVRLTAKVDTGNSLKEPFSQLPVVVVSFEAIRPLLPDELHGLFKGDLQSRNLLGTRYEEWMRKIRLVPFHALSGEGTLPAFKPDALTVAASNKSVEGYVAVSRSGIGSGEFSGLINPEMLNQSQLTNVRG